MRRVWCVFACFFFVLVFALNAAAVDTGAGIATVSINILNRTAEYDPQGYMPVADAGDYGEELCYEAIDNATGEKVDLPLTEVGTYAVRAYILPTETHNGAEAMATYRITPATAYIAVNQQTVAHTAMANPVNYSIYPAWAEELVEVSVSYRYISSLDDEGTEVEVPKDMGTYLVRMDATVNSEKAVCAGKYFIYTIGEQSGVVLSDEDARASVPKSFVSTVETVMSEYTGQPVVPSYSLNVAAVDGALKYSRIYADGSNGEYVNEPPVDPGDYIAACFVLDTVIGSSKIVINKVVAKITMEDKTVPYTPEGVGLPTVVTVPEGIELTYSAYKYVNGVAGEAVEFPLTECGTYLISASPKDIYRYSYVDSVSYCYITIEKIDPVISGEGFTVKEDGRFKSVSVSVSPDYAEYSLVYYKVEEDGATPLAGAPVEAGEYYALVSVKDSPYVNSATASYGIYIQPVVSEKNEVASNTIKGLCYLFGGLGILVAVFHIIWAKIVRRR